jgi:hypothetical protein
VSRDFLHAVFSSKHISRPPDSYPKAVSNINSNSPRYLNSKLISRCGPPPPLEDSILWCGPSCRIQAYNVAPSAGSNPTLWPLLQDRILQCGPPPRRIESYGVAPPAGSTLLGLERDRDRDCGPSRGIGLSAVAPPGGLDFPMWPLPGDRTFRCGPSRRIESYGVALPTGSIAALHDPSNILWEHAVAFKVTVYEKCVYGRTILPKTYNIHALDLL